MIIINKFKDTPKDILILILNYNGTIKYRNGIYCNTINEHDYIYNLIEPIINKKINIINVFVRERIFTSNIPYLNMVLRNHYKYVSYK